MPVLFAHSRNELGNHHDLVEHLESTALLASEFAEHFGGAELARHLGLWHDLGKFHPDFQRYLELCEGDNPPPRGPDHKAAGVRVALEHGAGLAATVIQGHHGGLEQAATLTGWVEQEERFRRPQAALQIARENFPGFDNDTPFSWPDYARRSETAAELFLRMIFSAVVDADFLDTEKHFRSDRSGLRNNDLSLADLLARFNEDQRRFDSAEETSVNEARNSIYQSCVSAATNPPGMFRLTVPTGGGKTRSGMAFALNHAVCHGQQRVIVAVPYLTITEQTAQEYRSIFEKSPDDQGRIVLEHHSGAQGDTSNDESFTAAAMWQRLAAENWDAPVIVTTTVQLFESLFDRKPGKSRKLHRLSNSVIILDEAQALPSGLLTPILDALRELTENYNTTVVLSTATQPAFQAIKGFAGLTATDIVPDVRRWFDVLRRVSFEWAIDSTTEWEELAKAVCDEKRALVVLNTKRDTSELLNALGRADDLLHLSTALCGAHRRKVVVEIRRRLDADEPCRVVSTQVVEAGVDIDFPFVIRALGPLDSIVQAAGRCNREGKLGGLGRVLVVRTPGDRMPPGAYKRATEIAEWVRGLGHNDPVRPDALREYFIRFLTITDTDLRHIQELREKFDFPAVAKTFRMIEDDTEQVVVTQYGTDEERQQVRDWLEELRAGSTKGRGIHRSLQPYIVNVRQPEVEQLESKGLLTRVEPSLSEWHGGYDETRGLIAEGLPDSGVV